jgi:hypothetical protein
VLNGINSTLTNELLNYLSHAHDLHNCIYQEEALNNFYSLQNSIVKIWVSSGLSRCDHSKNPVVVAYVGVMQSSIWGDFQGVPFRKKRKVIRIWSGIYELLITFTCPYLILAPIITFDFLQLLLLLLLRIWKFRVNNVSRVRGRDSMEDTLTSLH